MIQGIEYSGTYDPASIAANTAITTTVTVTGAVLGSYVMPSFSLSLANIILTAYVSADDSVTFIFFNPTGAAIDLDSGTLKAYVYSQ